MMFVTITLEMTTMFKIIHATCKGQDKFWHLPCLITDILPSKSPCPQLHKKFKSGNLLVKTKTFSFTSRFLSDHYIFIINKSR